MTRMKVLSVIATSRTGRDLAHGMEPDGRVIH